MTERRQEPRDSARAGHFPLRGDNSAGEAITAGVSTLVAPSGVAAIVCTQDATSPVCKAKATIAPSSDPRQAWSQDGEVHLSTR